MNTELLKKLEIDEKLGLKEILSALEDKQFECLERLETVNDDKRREELEQTLSQIDKEISEVKEQIKTVKSSIILDNGSEVEEEKAETKEAERKKKEEKKAEVSDKVKALKEREAQKQAEEAQRQQKEAAAKTEKAVQDVAASGINIQNTGKSPSAGGSQTSNIKPELSNGLVEYKKGNHPAAFGIFKNLAEKDDEIAQYMLANMYARGEGIGKNRERAEFWMKKSADRGYCPAQMDYAVFLLSGNDGDDKRISEGIKYLGMAADQDDKQAMLKFVEVAQKQLGTRADVEKAIKYCDKLKSQSKDSYDMQQYDDIKKQLGQMRKDALKAENKINRSTWFTIIGSVLTALGALYIFGGIHPAIWYANGFLKHLPGKTLLLPIDAVWTMLGYIMDANGMFGLELVLFGEMFVYAGDYIGKKKAANVVKKLASVVCVVVCLGHFAAELLEGAPIFTNVVTYAFVIAITYFIGKALGFILGKITRVR